MTLTDPPRRDDVRASVDLPVALVAVDVPLAHLDRGFEYAVPPELAADAVPGARVKVRFAGRDVGGYVLERRADPAHHGRLAPLRRVVSPEPVLTPRLSTLCRQVADATRGRPGGRPAARDPAAARRRRASPGRGRRPGRGGRRS